MTAIERAIELQKQQLELLTEMQETIGRLRDLIENMPEGAPLTSE